MSVDAFEHAARLFEPPVRRWESPAAMAAALDPRFIRTPALDLIDAALVELAGTTDGRLLTSVSPQEGKSTLISKWFPLWVLDQDPDQRLTIASYAMTVARRMGRLIRNEIDLHGSELGLRVSDDVGAQNEFEIAGHQGGVYAVGVGGPLTSRPVDGLIMDDLLKDRAEADSKVIRDRVWSWWTDVAGPRLAGGWAIGVFTRWHHDDPIGRWLEAEDGHIWRYINIPAQADHRPEHGETDPLGREPGEFMVSARGRTVKQWEAIKVRSGPRTWNALYQGRPTPGVGGIFPPSEKWSRYEHPMWVDRDDGARIIPDAYQDDVELVQSWDLAFKDTDASDFVVGQVWLRRGMQVFLLDQVRGRLSFTATLQAVKDLSARWPQAVAKFIEDKANGPAVMNALALSVPGMIPVEPEGSKVARAHAVSPLTHSGNVVLPDASIAPWVVDVTDECAEFPTGAHDDVVDALTQAVNRLLYMPIVAGEVVTSEDFEDDDEDALAYLGL